VTFVLPTDPDYLRAKQVRRGLAAPDPRFDRFVAQFRASYGVSPLTIALDSVERPRGEGRTPRLAVVLERTSEYRSFLAGSFVYDKDKQRTVASLLVETVPRLTLLACFDLPRGALQNRLQPDDIFVCFEDFERVAKWEVHEQATQSELEAFTSGLGIGDEFWCIQRLSGPPIVFVHTDAQAAALKASSLPDEWGDTYFEIARRHDEFGYLGRPEIMIQVDSRENFEQNYSSNWYYYFK
jgi:hypothetical protein